MANKRSKFAILLAAMSVFALTGCDTIEAKLPASAYDAEIVDVGSQTITNNKIGEIYDALITSGTSNSEQVLNQILYLYAQSMFGSFYDVVDSNGNVTEKGLYTIVNEGDDAIKTFVSTHSAFKGSDDEKSIVKVKAFYNRIYNSLAKTFFGYVTNSSYQERKIFFEKKFYDAQVRELYKLNDIEEADFKEVLVDGNDNYEDVDNYFNDFIVNYQGYIERSLLPGLYRTVITENFIITDSYGALGRSYARKVTYIALDDISDKEFASRKLVNAYCKYILNAESLTAADAPVDMLAKFADSKYRDLRFLSRLYEGLIPEDAEEAEVANYIYTEAGFTPVATVVDGEVVLGYEETTYGKLLKDWDGLTDDRNKTGTTKDFTNGGAYTKEVGFELQKRDIIGTSHVNEGWYTSSGLSDLPSSLKTRLFRINVANEVDVLNRVSGGDGKGSFGWYVAGDYYMVPEKYEASELYPYAIYDKDSKKTYIVRVEEAVKASKLTEDGDQSYANMTGRGYEDLETIVSDVVGLLAETDSYKTAAKQRAVKNMAVSYHDEYVYNYFKTTFPDLFD